MAPLEDGARGAAFWNDGGSGPLEVRESMSEDAEQSANTQARDRHMAREVRENTERAEARERVRAAQEQEKLQRGRRQTASRERAARRVSAPDQPPAAPPEPEQP